MNIVIPMAGLGSRFAQAGYATPKPLIPVLGKPMYAWAAESLPLAHARRTIFILLATQPECAELRADILTRFAAFAPMVLTVPALTRGQSETVLAARKEIANDEPLLIHNADTAFEIDPGWAAAAAARRLDGALLVFRSSERRWSYSREDADGRVVEVREKEVISPWASTGTYWWGRGRDFVELAEARVGAATVEGGEYYVGPLYNDLIARGARVANYEIRRLRCFGTPEDLAAMLQQLASSTHG
jgi:NDP-sugar pyrophosphorylase family protein